MTSEEKRDCTCHPDDNPPRPCPQKFAYSECMKAAAEDKARRVERELCLQAARSCAQFKCQMTDEIPRCPDCGATVTGDDPVNGVCQADAIRSVRADVIEAFLRRSLEGTDA